MNKNDKSPDWKEVYGRVDALSVVGASVEKAAKYLNAEFNLCFYAVKKTLWVSFMDGAQEQRRAIGAFA